MENGTLSEGDKTLSVSCTLKFNPNAPPLRAGPPSKDGGQSPAQRPGAPGPFPRICASGTFFTWNETSCLSSLLDCLPVTSFYFFQISVSLFVFCWVQAFSSCSCSLVAHGLSCPEVYGIFPSQGLNSYPLHW